MFADREGPSEFRDLHWAGFGRAIKTGRPRNPAEGLLLPAIDRDGERIEVEGTFGVVHDERGYTLGVAGILHRRRPPEGETGPTV